MPQDDLQQQLDAIRGQRDRGELSSQEAYRRHEELLRAATPPPAVAPAEVPVAAPAPWTAVNPPLRERVLPQFFLGAFLGALLMAVVIAAASVVAHRLEQDPRGSPSAIVAAMATPTVTPTPPLGCYDVESALDSVEVVAADPPLTSPPPTSPIKIMVKYNLASHDHADIVLNAGTSQVTMPISKTLTVQHGSGIITLVQLDSMPNQSALSYTVFLQPSVDVYGPLGYTCWRPLAQAHFDYTR